MERERDRERERPAYLGDAVDVVGGHDGAGGVARGHQHHLVKNWSNWSKKVKNWSKMAKTVKNGQNGQD